MCSYIPIKVTVRDSSLRGCMIYEVEITDTTLTLHIAVADNEPIDPVAMHETFIDTIRIARQKAEVWKGTTYLHANDDPFYSDTQLFPHCTIELESKNKGRLSRQRLKYGRVLLILRALNTFLTEGRRWHNSVVNIRDTGLSSWDKTIGDGSVTNLIDASLKGPGASNTSSLVECSRRSIENP